MIEEITKDIFRIAVPLPGNPLKELNSYFIRGKDRHLLIDTGFCQKPCLKALKEGLRELSVSMEETDIFLTHLHSDHTGLVTAIASPSTRVWIHPSDRDWITRESRFALEKKEDVQFLKAGIPVDMLASISITHPGRSLAPDPDFDRYETICGGQTFQVGDYEFQTVLTPGHTPGHLCLWLPKEQILFSGDHVLFDITPNITSWPNLPDALGHYLESLRQIRTYPVRLTLPSHRATGDLVSRVDTLLAHHEFRLQECLKVIREHPGSCPYDIAGQMTWRIRAKNWADFPESQKWFAVGECMSHLERLLAEDKIREVMEDGILRYYAVR